MFQRETIKGPTPTPVHKPLNKKEEESLSSSLTLSRAYDIFHLFWDALRKREEKKKKVERSKSAY
jgi:hypothetical protein